MKGALTVDAVRMRADTCLCMVCGEPGGYMTRLHAVLRHPERALQVDGYLCQRHKRELVPEVAARGPGELTSPGGDV